MALSTNSFRQKRYLRTKFKEGKYLLSNEATDLQLESQDLVREFIQFSYGDYAIGDAFKPEQTTSAQITIKPGHAWDAGVPFLLKSGTDAKVILGTVPSGITLSEVSATTSDAGGKRLVLSGLANGSYSIVVEAIEEEVKPTGTGAVDSYLQGVNVPEETALKSRLIYKIHVVETSTLTSSPVYPLVTSHLVNEISVTPTGGANFLISAVDITQDLNGADRRIILDNASGNIPYGSAAQDFISGVLVDSDGNEMVMTSIITTDGGATVQILLDREVDYNSSSAKAGLPVITTNVPYTLKKNDFYTTSTSGTPLGHHYWRICDFVTVASLITSITDKRIVAEVNSFEKDLNIKLIGGGNLTWSTSTNNLTFSANLQVSLPGVAGQAVIQTASSPINIPTNGQVAYILLDRNAAINYNVIPTVALKSALPTNVNVFVIAERFNNRLYFPDNGSFGDAASSALGGGSEALPPVGSIIPFYDFNALITFDTNIWQYCDGQPVSDVASPINGETLPDLSGRYLVGFGTDGAGDNDTAAWSSAAVGNTSHQIAINHDHTMQSHTHNMNSHTHTMSGHTHTFSSAHSHSLTPGTAWAEFQDTGSATDRALHWRSYNTGFWTSNENVETGGLDYAAGGTGFVNGVGVDGNTDSGTASGTTSGPNTASTGGPSTGSTLGPSTANTSVSLSSTQSIQPRSVRVRYIIRKR